MRARLGLVRSVDQAISSSVAASSARRQDDARGGRLVRRPADHRDRDRASYRRRAGCPGPAPPDHVRRSRFGSHRADEWQPWALAPTAGRGDGHRGASSMRGAPQSGAAAMVVRTAASVDAQPVRHGHVAGAVRPPPSRESTGRLESRRAPGPGEAAARAVAGRDAPAPRSGRPWPRWARSCPPSTNSTRSSRR